MPVYNRITAEDVRSFIMDRTIADNDLSLDLTFSDEEISNAMLRCAREYNSIPPFVGGVDPNNLPGDTNIFLDGTAQQLFISRINKLMRNDIDYTAGNVTTNIVGKQISHLKELIRLHGDRFRETARAIKVSINLHNCYGQVG